MKHFSHMKPLGMGGATKDRMITKGMTAAVKPSKAFVAIRSKPAVPQDAKKSVFDYAEDEPRSNIQWPNDDQIGSICARLRQVKKIGMENEGLGDHFSSGDLAYQVQEIIRSTDELFRKSLRVKKNAA